MPVPNTRIAVVGTAKADKDFTILDNDRKRLQALIDKFGGDLERVSREIERDARG